MNGTFRIQLPMDKFNAYFAHSLKWVIRLVIFIAGIACKQAGNWHDIEP